MNELELREFRTRAEELVSLPDLADLESRGRRLRRRRVALGASLAAAVLALAGGLVVTQRDDGNQTPIEPPDERPPSEVDYPGPVMEPLAPGTYVLRPSLQNGAPEVRLTVPPGWNAWQGPNRFDGDLNTTGWYAGVLVVDVTSVASKKCRYTAATGAAVDGSAADLIAAINRIPGLRVTTEAAPAELFGYPATHLHLRTAGAFCRDGNNLFDTEQNGLVIGGTDTLADTWVVDVDGEAILIDVGFTPTTPTEIRRELDEIVESIEVVDPE